MGAKSLAVLGATAAILVQAAPTVTIANGTLRGGKCSQADVDYFLSIPYAKPPLGSLRFAAPQPYNQSFGETYDATKQALTCPQFGTLFVDTSPASEDWYVDRSTSSSPPSPPCQWTDPPA